MSTVDPDRACVHDFAAKVDVNRLQKADDDPTIVAFMADIRVWCVGCGEQFRWTGLQAGMSPREPMVSPDERELRAPLRPGSSDPDFGMGLPGFAIQVREG